MVHQVWDNCKPIFMKNLFNYLVAFAAIIMGFAMSACTPDTPEPGAGVSVAVVVDETTAATVSISVKTQGIKEFAYILDKEVAATAILAGGTIGTHIQMGIGDGFIPDILNTEIYDDVCIVKDEEALQTSKDLASKEGIMCGISSGTNVAAALRLAKKLGKGYAIVAVGGEMATAKDIKEGVEVRLVMGDGSVDFVVGKVLN